MKKIHVTVVDDNAIFRTLIQYMLQHFDDATVQVTLLEDGAEAMEHFQKHGAIDIDIPHILFLDIDMPFMTGWEFLDVMEGESVLKQTEIYILSSSISTADEQRSKNYGYIRDYLRKPIDKQDLFAILRKHLNL
ncbi:response regulator [Sphingobacterium suaedae]|uniref:Response regulator n=1 Tax=Sphingobacterium suaedae TaxID=1686402 RepID=A0ABW5KMR7_9SPHI